MTEPSELATRLAILAVLRQRVAEAYELARTEVAEALETGDRKTAHLDGRKLGAATVVTGRTTARVTDEAALLAWVAERYPSEITQAVRPAFVNKLLADAKTYGDGVDVRTGELVDGITVSQAAPYVRMSTEDDAAEAVASAWAQAVAYVPELVGGTDG